MFYEQVRIFKFVEKALRVVTLFCFAYIFLQLVQIVDFFYYLSFKPFEQQQ